jgi:TonB-linked SusC/RagA family outer membrane protein
MNKKNKIITKTLNSIAGILLVLVAVNAKAQDTLLVKGIVLDAMKQPISNVSVGVEGSFEIPAVTNEKGEFSLKTAFPDVWLYFDPTSGYKQKRIFLDNRSDLTIYLTSEDVVSGDDPSKILSQQLARKNIVSSMNTLTAENIRLTPSITADQYMQGRISGMNIINRSGDPGSGTSTFTRGVNSINSSNQPLYVVDGMPITSFGVFESNLAGFSYNPLLSINPLDVSKITVIKDPTVTTAYGSKASNGVILVETLDPSTTQTVIDLDLRMGYSLAPEKNISQLNAAQHKTLIQELLFSSGMNEEDVKEQYPSLYLTPSDDGYINYQHDTDWQQLIFTNAFTNNLNLSVKGGDEIARYGLSFGFQNAEGIVKNTGNQGYNIRFIGLLNIFTWLKMNTGVALNYNNSQLKEAGKVAETNPILSSLGKSPMLNPFKYDTEGQEMSLLAEVDELGVSNPQAVIYNYEANNTNFNFNTTMGLEATLKKNLLLTSNFGITYNMLKEKIFMPNMGMERYYNKEAHNVSKAANNSLLSFYNNTYLYFNKSFGRNHHLSSSTGFHILTNNFEYDWALTKNSHENDQYRMLQDGTNNLRETGGQNRKWNWLSIYENVNYSFQDKYLATLTLSLDGSSILGENAENTLKIGGYPFGFFYAAGGAWRFSNENFLKHKAWLEELKLRLTYGISGNDNIGETNATRYYDVIRFRESTGLYNANINNDELTYETVSQLNGGIDLAVLGNRFRTSFDLYQAVTSNMLIYQPINAYFGYDYQPVNGGKMQNRGIDVNLFSRIFDRSNFKWDFQVTFSNNQNEVLDTGGEKLVTEIRGAEIVNMAGEKANSFYGYIYEGVNATSTEAKGRALVNDKFVPFEAGDAIYSDISGPNGSPDGIINQYDKTVIGSSMPDFFGSIQNTFKYKRFTLDIFLQAITGNEVFNYIRYQNESMIGIQNQSTNVLYRWQYEGQQTEVPRALYNDPIGNSAFSTRWIEDGSYLRIKNISLSYFIPDKFLAFRNAQFYISASNIFTFSEYLGYDPEFSYSRSHIEQGIDYGLTPQPRQFILGIKLGL